MMASPFEGVRPADLVLLEDLYPEYKKTQPDPGVWITDARNDITDAFNQGPWTELKTVQPPNLQEVQFKMFDNTAYMNGLIPWKRIGPTEYAIPMVTIETLAYQGAVGNNMFRCTETYGPGVTAFRYEGPDTMHGLLRGDINVVMRIRNESDEQQRLAGGSPTQAPILWVALVNPNGKPGYESRDRQVVAVQSNWSLLPVNKLNNRMASPAQPYPPYAQLVADLAAVAPIAHTVEVGTIDANSVNPTLNATGINGQALTTSWMNIQGETAWLLQDVGGVSNRCRVQFKDENGAIWYDNQVSSGTASAAKLLSLHPRAIQARITFRSTSAAATDITVKRLPPEKDQWSGTWAHYKLSINHMVNIEPGFDYRLHLVMWEGWNFVADPNGFYMTASGLSLLQNARPNLYDDLGRLEKP